MTHAQNSTHAAVTATHMSAISVRSLLCIAVPFALILSNLALADGRHPPPHRDILKERKAERAAVTQQTLTCISRCIETPPTQPPTEPPAKANFEIGQNFAGMECGEPWDGWPLGHAISPDDYFPYWAGKHVYTIRLPFRWERLQPTINGPLDQAYLAQIEAVLDKAAANNETVLIDNHNYAEFVPGDQTNGCALPNCQSYHVGDPQLPGAALGDLWAKLASALSRHQNIRGYDIMNEPQSVSDSAWTLAAQATIDAIRRVDTHTPIYVEATNWSNANGWADSNPTIHTLRDLSNHLVFSAHNYANQSNCQDFATWGSCNTPNTMVDNYRGSEHQFGDWCKSHHFTCHIGEGGTGQDPRLLEMLDNATRAYKEDNVAFDYWSGGPCGQPSAYDNTNLTPSSWGPPATGIPPQTDILLKYVP